MAMGLSNQPLPNGNRVAVITNAGGPGVMATDALETLGLKMARFEPETIAYLRANLLPMAAVNNPIDVIASGGPEAYGAAVEASLRDPNVDAVIVIFVPPILVDHKAVINTVIERVKKYPEWQNRVRLPDGIAERYCRNRGFYRQWYPSLRVPRGRGQGNGGDGTISRHKGETAGERHLYSQSINAKVRNIIDRLKGQKVILGQDALDILIAYGIKVPGRMRAVSEADMRSHLGKH